MADIVANDLAEADLLRRSKALVVEADMLKAWVDLITARRCELRRELLQRIRCDVVRTERGF